MDLSFLHNFYEKVILLQFDTKLGGIEWVSDKELDNDVHGFWFNAEGDSYILIWQDYGGTTKPWVAELLKLNESDFEIIAPLPTEYENEVWLRFGSRYHYVEYITGSHALLNIKS